MGDSSDRRGERRELVTLMVDYADRDDLVSDYTENLSMGGTFVLTGRSIEVGARAQLLLSCPGLIDPIPLTGIVRWRRAGSDVETGVGVQFEPYNETVRKRLGQIMTSIRAGDPSVIGRVVNVLIVEDNRHVVNLIRDGLRLGRHRLESSASFRFHTATDGAVALELLEHRQFDAAIVDMFLPVVDGQTLITAIRANVASQYLKVIAISAGGREAADAALAAGADRFLSKPIRLREVADALAALTAQ